MRKHNEFWSHGGRKMRGHSGPEIARQSAAHIQAGIQPDQKKDWMGGRISDDPPQDNQTGATAMGPEDAMQPQGRPVPDGGL